MRKEKKTALTVPGKVPDLLPLQGVRILDFSWVLAGPYVTRLLADFGAEVIKIQSPQKESSDLFSRGYYNTWNRNKFGLGINLSQPSGKEIICQLVKVSDVVVENFSPRVMAGWELDYEHLKSIKEDIVMLSMSISGHSGPEQDYSGFGPTVHALAGMTSMTAYPGDAPCGPGFAYADHAAALYGSLAVLGALEFRRKSGQGQYIDLSQKETLASLMNGELWKSNRANESFIQGVYACRGIDKWCAITIDSESEWLAFKALMDNPQWAEGSRFVCSSTRHVNADELDKLINQWTGQRTAEDVESLLQSAGIAACEVKSSADLMEDKQLKSRGFFVHLEHPTMGETLADASPIRLRQTPAAYRSAAPEKGQDTSQVLKKILGLKTEVVEDLKQSGIIF
jgi:crotonobetainyl-CoA:carnitine CoA-transferase CaiB-like acyl-CoA transferase